MGNYPVGYAIIPPRCPENRAASVVPRGSRLQETAPRRHLKSPMVTMHRPLQGNWTQLFDPCRQIPAAAPEMLLVRSRAHLGFDQVGRVRGIPLGTGMPISFARAASRD